VKRIVIIGGGISGLAAAHRLVELSDERKQPVKLTILEASSRLGGTIQTENRDGFLLERGPDSFISEKPEALALASRLGLTSHLIKTNEECRRSFIVKNGKLRPVPEGFQLLAPSRIWPFITTDIFSLGGKVRMSADLFLPRRKSNGTDDETLARFVRRRLGNEALTRMAQPMVGGIYTADPESLSLKATLPRFLDMEREHRSIILAMLRQGRLKDAAESRGTSGARYGLFLSFDSGMTVIVEALEKHLARVSRLIRTDIRLNTRVDAVTSNNEKWTVTFHDGEAIEADAVCLALPAYAAGSLLGNTSPQLTHKLNQIKYASTATVNFAYRRADINHPLDGFGFVVPFIEKRSLMACTFSSVKFPGRAPHDHVLLRAFVGGALQPDMFALDESEIISLCKADLCALLQITGEPLFAEVAKWKESMPQYEVGHLDRVDAIDSELGKLPGLTLAGNSYHGAGVPDCIRSGEAAAEIMIK
jgi:protoporphyrinogen/coproporphyrinogen III oxidase